MVECKVQIIEIIDDSFYPGFCKAVLTDSFGQKHVIVDKPPIFGFDLSDVDRIPFDSTVCCEVIKDLGENAVIDIGIPDAVETEDECHLLTVPKSSLIASEKS